MFRLRAPYCAYTDVVSAIPYGGPNLILVVTRNADERSLWEQIACLSHRHVRLPNVDSSGIDSNGNINAVVDQQRDIIAIADDFGLLRDLEKLGASRSTDRSKEWIIKVLTSAVSACFSRI